MNYINRYEEIIEERRQKNRQKFSLDEREYQKYIQFRNKIIWISIIIFVIAYIFFKIYIGIFNINLGVYSYPRTYEVLVNGENISGDLIEDHKFSLIPTILNGHTYYNSTTYNNNKKDSKIYLDEKVKINIKIIGLMCYNNINGKDLEMGCKKDTNKYITKEVNDTTYTIKIYDNNIEDNKTCIYDGALIEDISSYIRKGIYQIEIYGKYNNVTSKITFWIEVK